MLENTPSAEKKKYRTATATNKITKPMSDAMKLNFMTDHGSILDSTSCASRGSVPSDLTPLVESCAAGRRGAVGLLLTVTAGLPLPIAPPGFPIALGLSFFFFPGLVNGLATCDFWSSDRTDSAAANPGLGVLTCSGACAATGGGDGICAPTVGGDDISAAAAGAARPEAAPTRSPAVVGAEPPGEYAGFRGGSKALPPGPVRPADPAGATVWSCDRGVDDPAAGGVRSAAVGAAGLAVAALRARAVAAGPGEAAVGDFQPMLGVAVDEVPAARAGPPDEGVAEGDDGPAAVDAPGEGGALACRVTSPPVSPVLVNPGLAKPAPVSSRVSAAAASVDVASSCEPPPWDPPPWDPPPWDPPPWDPPRSDPPGPGGGEAGDPFLPRVGLAVPEAAAPAVAGRC